MQSSIITTLILPIALAVIMLGMGMGLEPADFRRIGQQPKAALVGLVGQLVLLPMVGFALALLLPWSMPAFAVGLVILACSPGGATSNLFTFLARGDVPLSISLTAVSSVVSVITLPILVNLGLATLMDRSATVRLPILESILQIVAITLVPVAIGMWIRRRFPAAAARSEPTVRVLSGVLLAIVVVGALARERAIVLDGFVQVGLGALLLNLSTMAIGWAIAAAARLRRPQRVTIAIEVGIQNGTLAIAIASSPLMLNSPDMALTPAIYSLIMFATAGAFAAWTSRGARSGTMVPGGRAA